MKHDVSNPDNLHDAKQAGSDVKPEVKIFHGSSPFWEIMPHTGGRVNA
mgnify:CR=1 FL=1